MSETPQQDRPPELPTGTPWHMNWFIVNLGFPFVWMFGLGVVFVFVAGLNVPSQFVIVGTGGLTVGLVAASCYLNLRICRPQAKGNLLLLGVMVLGSTCLSIALAFTGCMIFLS